MSKDRGMSGPATRLTGVLAELGEIVDTDDESVIVRLGATRASVRPLSLAAGLDVISVIQMVATDVPNTAALREDVETCDRALVLGALRRSDPGGDRTDVLLYYTFPAGSLDDSALVALLNLVLASGVQSAETIAG